MNIKRILHLQKLIIIICFIFTEQKIISSDNPQTVTMQPLRQDELNEQTIKIMRLEKIVTEQEQRIAALETKNKSLLCEIIRPEILRILILSKLCTKSANPQFDATKKETVENAQYIYTNKWASLKELNRRFNDLDETYVKKDDFNEKIQHLAENSALIDELSKAIESKLKKT